MQRPDWLAEDPPAEAAAITVDDMRRYAECYGWALRRRSDPDRAHAAATAAAPYLRLGPDPAATAAATAAAERALEAEPDPGRQAVPNRVREYAEWYAWAMKTLDLSGPRAHEAAAAAQQSLFFGGGADRAALAARAATGKLRLSLAGRLARDPGVRGIAWGTASLLLAGLPFWLLPTLPRVGTTWTVVLPLPGLLFAARGVAGRHLATGVAGVALCCLAVVEALVNQAGL